MGIKGLTNKEHADFVYGGVTFSVKPFGLANPSVRRYAGKVGQRAKSTADRERAAAESLGPKAFVESCLVGWENAIDDETLQPIPFSKAKAIEILEQPEYGVLFSALVEFACDPANFAFAGANDEADAGN